MSDIVIEADRLSKYYRLGVIGSGTLHGDLSRWWARLRGRPDPLSRVDARDHSGESDQIWALRDVSFQVGQGTALGLIGRNGAGKSTLLKVLSRITAPTEGRVRIRGRLASLLEVGTGFHPELTGRENIFLNGAILGMTRREITQRFDEITAFAEIDEFIDTPVKRYSSGMVVRLAFSVAAHLEPEILVVDEVLAVGDLSFQRKCLGKMGEVSHQGRTIIFVSHNMGAISQLCSAGLWLHQGSVKQSGEIGPLISAYLAETSLQSVEASVQLVGDPDKRSHLRSVAFRNRAGEDRTAFDCDEPVLIELEYTVRMPIRGLYGYLELMRPDQTVVLVSDSFDSGGNPMGELPVGTHRLRITIPARTLGHGEYLVYLNFTETQASGVDVDSPGIVGRFTLDDVTSSRGNRRGGFFSTIVPWSLVDAEA